MLAGAAGALRHYWLLGPPLVLAATAAAGCLHAGFGRIIRIYSVAGAAIMVYGLSNAAMKGLGSESNRHLIHGLTLHSH